MKTEEAVAVPRDAILEDAYIQVNHVDGPLLHWASYSHWLTLTERLSVWFGITDANDLADIHWARSSYIKMIEATDT